MLPLAHHQQIKYQNQQAARPWHFIPFFLLRRGNVWALIIISIPFISSLIFCHQKSLFKPPVKPSNAQPRSALPSFYLLWPPLSPTAYKLQRSEQESVLIKACEEQGLRIGKLFCYPIWAWTLWNKTLWNQMSTDLWLKGILWTNLLLLCLPMLTIPPWSWYSTISPPTYLPAPVPGSVLVIFLAILFSIVCLHTHSTSQKGDVSL